MPNTQQKLNSSIFPDFPRHSPVIGKDGNLTDNWHLQLSSLFQALQKNFTNEGIQIPQLSADEIAQIQAIYAPFVGQVLPQTLKNINGKKVFDATNSAEKTFIITFTVLGDVSTPITYAQWKTVTLT